MAFEATRRRCRNVCGVTLSTCAAGASGSTSASCCARGFLSCATRLANAESEDAMAPRRALRDVVRNLSLKAVSLGLERGGRFLVAVAAAACLGQTSFGRFVF